MTEACYVSNVSMKRIRKMKGEYISLFPDSPLSTMTSDQDILLFMIFFAESMMEKMIEKKKEGGPE
jgi:hypothetical protein